MRLVTVKERELTPSAATEAGAGGSHRTCTGGRQLGKDQLSADTGHRRRRPAARGEVTAVSTWCSTSNQARASLMSSSRSVGKQSTLVLRQRARNPVGNGAKPADADRQKGRARTELALRGYWNLKFLLRQSAFILGDPAACPAQGNVTFCDRPCSWPTRASPSFGSGREAGLADLGYVSSVLAGRWRSGW